MKRREVGNRVSVLGIDGSGKSTATHHAALQLSKEYEGSAIQVVDSSGIVHYRDGGVTNIQFENIEQLKADESASRLASVGRTALFTSARRTIETLSLMKPNSLTIGVRDPYRVDPATYLPLFIKNGGKLSPERRLSIFSKLTTAAHPAFIAHLKVDPQEAYTNTVNRGVLDSHETPEGLARAADDLNRVVEAYSYTYSVRSAAVEALRPDTADTLAMHLEEFVPSPKDIGSKKD